GRGVGVARRDAGSAGGTAGFGVGNSADRPHLRAGPRSGRFAAAGGAGAGVWAILGRAEGGKRQPGRAVGGASGLGRRRDGAVAAALAVSFRLNRVVSLASIPAAWLPFPLHPDATAARG